MATGSPAFSRKADLFEARSQGHVQISTPEVLELFNEAVVLEQEALRFCDDRKKIEEGPAKVFLAKVGGLASVIRKLAMEAIKLEQRNAVLESRLSSTKEVGQMLEDFSARLPMEKIGAELEQVNTAVKSIGGC